MKLWEAIKMLHENEPETVELVHDNAPGIAIYRRQDCQLRWRNITGDDVDFDGNIGRHDLWD